MRLAARSLPVLLLLAALAAPALAQYTVTDLGTLGGATSVARAINAGGVVVGYSDVSASTIHAFRWDGTLHDLGTLGGPNSYAYGINSANVIVGGAQMSGTGTPERAYAILGGTMTDLGDLGGPTATAYAINTAGDITGSSDTSPAFGNTQAFLVHTGTMTPLTGLGGQLSVGFAVNTGMDVAGTAYLSGNTVFHAAMWSGSGVSDLGTLGGVRSVATAMNDAGVVAGFSNFFGGVGKTHAFVRVPGGAPHDLGALGTGDRSQGWGMNGFGQIVGWSTLTLADTLTHHAFISNGSVMYDLNDNLPPASGWVLNEAYGITNSGQIVGVGTHGVARHAFLITPSTLSVGGGRGGAMQFAGAYPNPVRQSAEFAYTLGSAAPVRLVLYDVSGRLARTLDAGSREAGRHEIAWDGRDESGAPVAAGLYFARFEAAGASLVRRVSVTR